MTTTPAPAPDYYQQINRLMDPRRDDVTPEEFAEVLTAAETPAQIRQAITITAGILGPEYWNDAFLVALVLLAKGTGS